jgi:hypothetical protein
VLSGRGFSDGLIIRPEESYRLWRVVVCDHETSKNEEAKARYRAVENTTRWVVTPGKQTTTKQQCGRYFHEHYSVPLLSVISQFLYISPLSGTTYSCKVTVPRDVPLSESQNKV